MAAHGRELVETLGPLGCLASIDALEFHPVAGQRPSVAECGLWRREACAIADQHEPGLARPEIPGGSPYARFNVAEGEYPQHGRARVERARSPSV